MICWFISFETCVVIYMYVCRLKWDTCCVRFAVRTTCFPSGLFATGGGGEEEVGRRLD